MDSEKVKELYYSLFRGVRKNNKQVYFLKGFLRLLVPRWYCRWRLKHELAAFDKLSEAERIYVQRRVDYYCRLTEPTLLPVEESAPLSEHTYKKHTCRSVYFFDTYEYLRYFDPKLRWRHEWGDVDWLCPYPSIVKSRPVTEDDSNRNSVLLNQDKVRHFMFFNDPIPWREKADRVVFRGAVMTKENRRRFMERFKGNPLFDLADTDPHSDEAKPGESLSIYKHLHYKFIMALEGNDVASNLKWVMGSNSLAVMPRPTCETWFMEGTLRPNYHYVEVKPDFSDVEDRIRYYMAHPNEAEEIVEHAHAYVRQFFNPSYERLISLMVLKKYFEKTSPSHP
jgi:hypothetical protein